LPIISSFFPASSSTNLFPSTLNLTKLLTKQCLKGFCNDILARTQLGLHNSLLIHDATSLSLLSVTQVTYYTHEQSPDASKLWSKLAQQ
jgi:hypothetical protein